MLVKVFNTLRVLVDGPEFPEDTSLVPSNLFIDRAAFVDAVIELFEKTNSENKFDSENLFNFIRYCICIDTSIRHRLNENSGGYIDGALIQPDDYVNELNRIDQTFGVTDESMGINILSGSQNQNPTFAGLTGALLLSAKEVLGQDQYEVLRIITGAYLGACKGNPSATNIWWLDALYEIYSYESQIDPEEENWLNPNGEEDTNYVIQIWYLQLTNALAKVWDAFDECCQNLPEGSIAFQLLDYCLAKHFAFVEEHIEKIKDGFICETIPLLKESDRAYTIEQCLINVLVNSPE